MNRWPSLVTVLWLVLSPCSLYAQAPPPPTVIKVFHLESVSAQSLESTLKQLFTTEINIAAYTTTNSLLVRGTDAQLQEVEALISLVDRPREQPAESRPAVEGWPQEEELIPSVKQQYRNHEQTAAKLAQEIRQAAPEQARQLREKLKEAVGKAFRLRQQMHRAELKALEQQVHRVSQTLEVRERLQEQVVERRVQELLNPDLSWDSIKSSSNKDDTSNATASERAISPPSTPAKPPTPEQSKLVIVLKAQLDSLQALWISGKATLPELLQCHNNLLQARLDIARDAGERVAALQTTFEGLSALHQVLLIKVKTGLESDANRLAAEAALLTVQRDLLAELKARESYGARESDAAINKAQPNVAADSNTAAEAATPLLDAVRQFNEQTSQHALSKDQPPLTDDEVVASVLLTAASEEVDGLEQGDFVAFRRIGEERVMPEGWRLELQTELNPSEELRFQIWKICLTLQRPNGSSFTHVIREQVLRQLTATGEPMELPPVEPSATTIKGTPLAAAINGFNSEHRSLDGQEQPPLTEEEVVAAIRAWQAKRNDAPVTNDEFTAFQRIADERLIPENSRFELIGSFGQSDGSICYVWSVRIVMPQTAKPGWTYAFSIRERYLRLKRVNDDEISWGPAALNGLQVGVRLDPHNAEYSSDQQVGTHFSFRNTGKQVLEVAFPRLFTHGYYREIHVSDATGKSIPIDRDPGPGGPVGWIQTSLSPGDQHDVRGGRIVFGMVERPEGVETVVQAEPGQSGRLSFTIPNYADSQGPPLTSGQVAFVVSKGPVDTP